MSGHDHDEEVVVISPLSARLWWLIPYLRFLTDEDVVVFPFPPVSGELPAMMGYYGLDIHYW